MRLRLIPLGTSAGRPRLVRGASALAVATDGAWVLCDCGEGAQLAAQRAGLSFSRLDAVLITHLHGDHFNGLPGLLGTLGLEGRERPLVVAGPAGIAELLQHLARAGPLGIGEMEVRLFVQNGAGRGGRLGGAQCPAREPPAVWGGASTGWCTRRLTSRGDPSLRTSAATRRASRRPASPPRPRRPRWC